MQASGRLARIESAKFHVRSGVMVTQVRPGLLFDDTQIPVGSIITSINKQPVNNSDDISNAIANMRNGNLIIQAIILTEPHLTTCFSKVADDN